MTENGIKLTGISLPKETTRILDLLDDCVFMVNIDGTMVYYNPAGEKFHNMTKEFVVGRHITECFSVNEETSITLRALATQQPLLDIYQDYMTVTGSHITTVSNSYPLFHQNQLIGALTVTKNTTKFERLLNILYQESDKICSDDSDSGDAEINYVFDQIVGNSRLLKMSINVAQKASQTTSSVLLYGETGTGKEVFAQSIHNASNVRGPFISLNCAAIPENLLEGILFGTVKGAFTGSIDRAGLFEEASAGTLFLDELNSMSLNLQSKLLRAIETGKIRRVGETKERSVKPRIISALNVPPLQAIAEGFLRQDLFYRLGVIILKLPSLAERKEDISLLTNHFIRKFNKKFSRNVSGLSDYALELLMSYSWPGNVRELEHAVEYAFNLIMNETIITEEYLPPTIMEQFYENAHDKNKATTRFRDNGGKDLKSFLEAVEQETIQQTLKATDGNVSAAAKKLGLNRQSLDYKLKKYGLA